MIYVSIDIETTGLSSENCQILSIGLAVEDTKVVAPIEKIPTLEIAIIRERIEGEIFAINMNRELISDILRYKKAKTDEERNEISRQTKRIYVKEDEVVHRIFRFLYENRSLEIDDKDFFTGMREVIDGKSYPAFREINSPYHLTVAGKNFGTFDKLFLEKLHQWKRVLKVRSRILDPALLYVDWEKDEDLPGLSKCKERAGLSGVVSHNAVEDALDVIELIRRAGYARV
jgi:oligoribonuclease